MSKGFSKGPLAAAIAAPLVGALVGVAFFVGGVGRNLDLRLLDFFQGTKVSDDSSPVLIVDIDTDSIIVFGWPISPEVYALVIQALHDAGAQRIGVDVLFRDQRLQWSEHAYGPGVDSSAALQGEADDEDLLLAMVARSTNAVLATYRATNVTADDVQMPLPATPSGSLSDCGHIDEASWLSSLRAGLGDAPVGHVHLEQSADGSYRRIAGCLPVHDGCALSLTSLLLAEKDGKVSCKSHIIPYDRSFEDYHRLSMNDVVAMMDSKDGEEALQRAVEGKYVLIGPSDPGVGDLGGTPASRSEPLVTVHANRLEAELAGRHISEITPWQAMVAGVFVLVVLSFLTLPARYWLVTGGMVVIGAIVVSFGAFRLLSLWLPPSPFVLPLLVGALSAAGWGGWVHFRFNQMLTQAFGSYVSPDVLDWLQETSGTALDPTAAERRTISVLFSDIAGYTRMSNDLRPEEVMRSLRMYLETMVAVVQRHGGYVDKINGDGLMVLFGAPRASDQHASSVVACALDMLREVDRLGESWRAVTSKDLRIRIGVATGKAFVGNLGGEGHVEYTAIGTVVNLAARLESQAPVGGVLIDETTCGAVCTLPPGVWTEVTLKGYEAEGPVRVFCTHSDSEQV